jgi:N-alpha-acetyl-L-2,4-diaminobutyrate deacetylase
VPDLAHYVFAPSDGIWEAANPVGATVEAGTAAGFLHRIEDPAAPPVVLPYRATGQVWCARHAGRVKVGDPVAVIAHDL